MPVGENAESRARKAIDAQDPKQGQEMQQVQALQSSIQEIQGERNNNLMAARMGAEGDARENQAMLQAAEMGMLGGAAGGAVAVENATPIQQTSPQTQAILSKYGVGKPKNQRVTTRNVQQTPTKITINNNTTNNTTNNVAVPAANVGGPVQGRTLAIKQQPDQGQARFKTWISNAFARQNQAAAQREKEYQRREWSLSRTTGKLMKKLQELGTTISERMDPRKIASSATNHFKTLLFLFGTMFLAKNWEKVIKIGASIERFFLGDAVRDGSGKITSRTRSGFAKMLIGAFGGDPESKDASIGKTIKDFFYTGDKNRAGVFDLVLEKIKHFFEIRGEAIKTIQPPKLDFSNIGETLTSMLGYLGDILKVMMAGPEAAKEGIIKSINRNAYGVSSSDDRKKEGEYDIYKTKPEKGALLGSGGAVALKGKNYINEEDFDSNGNLRDTASATISQARDIDRFEKIAKETGEVNITPIIQGYQRLKDTAERNKNKKIVVDPDWIKNKINNPEVYDNLVNSGDIITRKYRLVKRPRTKDELNDLAAGKDFLTAGITQYAIDGVAGGYLKKTGVDIIRGRGDLAAKRALYDVVTLGNVGGAGDMLLALDEGQSSNSKKKAIENNKVFDIYPVDEKLPEGWELPNYKHLRNKIFEYSEVSSRAIDEIIRGLTGKDIEINNTDMNYINSMQKYVEKLASNNSDGNEITYGKGQDIIGDIEKISELDKKEDEYRKIEQQHLNTSNVKKAGEYVENEIINPVVDTVSGYISHNNYTNVPLREPEKLSKGEYRDRIIKTMEFAMNELGMTKEQAAGLAGNFMRESSMTTTARNPSPSAATGLAQWLGVRKAAFEHSREFTENEKSSGWKYYDGPGSGKPLANASFEEQLKFVKWEMENIPSYREGLKKIKQSKDHKEAAANVFGYYEFSAGPQGAVKAMNESNQDGLGSLNKGINFAGDALLAYNTLKGEEQKTPQEGTPTTQPDASGTYITQNTLETPRVTEYGVEYNGQTYNPEFAQNLGSFDISSGRWNWGENNNALAMADNASKPPTVTPESSRQISGGINSGSTNSGSPTLKTADQMSSSSTNNTDNLLTGINTQLTNLNTLTAAASDQQVQATMTIAQAIGNMQITISNEKSPQTSVSSWGSIPGSNET